MGNHVSTVKVILLNGSVQEFQNPLTAAELMVDHPQQVVVEVPIPRRPAPLPADKKLQANTVYLMLPIRRGKPAALTPEESRRVLLTANKVLRSRNLMSLPVLAKMCDSTVDEDHRIVLKQRNMPLPEMELPGYLTPQLSGKGWKPCLDTIKEKKLEQNYSHCFFRL